MQLPQFQIHAQVEGQHWWFLGRREIARALIGHLHSPSKKTRVLDVGCGTGGITAFFDREYSCMGIDPIPEAIVFARDRHPGVTFLCGKAPDDVFKEMKEADVVLLMDVLEHVEDDHGFVRSILQAMRPGASLLLMAPADPSLWSPHDAGFEHYRRYDWQTWQVLLKDQPAKMLMASFCMARLHPVVKLVRLWTRMRGKAFGDASSDVSVPSAPVNAVLRWIFTGEKRVLLGLLQRKRSHGYRTGVSVMAVLQKI